MGIQLKTMRERIARCYDGIAWKEKCEKMPPSQVFAIYHKFIRDGKLDDKGRPTRFQQPNKNLQDSKCEPKAEEWAFEPTPNGPQMSIFDFMK